MGNNMKRNNRGNQRPPRQNRSPSQSCNRHTETLASPPRPANPARIAARRTIRERNVSQSRSRVASASGTSPRTLSSNHRRPATLKRSRPRHSQPRTNRALVNPYGRRRRTRPRSRPNAQSGGPVGGDLAVPGDQPTSPQPPQEVQSQTANAQPETADVIRPNVCLPQTSSPPLLLPRSPCISALVSACNSCQRIAPTRWKLLRKSVQKLSGSLSGLKGYSPGDTKLPDEPSSIEFSSDTSEGALVTGPSEIPAADNDAIIPPTETGFYFGTTNRQSWPHTVASAEYFTVVSARRMKKVEPSLHSDEMTTTFEVDEIDPDDQRHPLTARDDNISASEVANAAAAAAAVAFVGSNRCKKSSRQHQSIKRTRGTRNATISRICTTARFRRMQASKTSSTNLRVSVMHDVLRRIFLVGQRRKDKCFKKNADDRNPTNDERVRATSIVTPPSVKSRSAEKEAISPASCLSGARSSQEGRPNRRNVGHNSIKRDGDKQPGSLRVSRESRRSLSYRNVRECPSSHCSRAPQDRAEGHHRKHPGAPIKRFQAKSSPGKGQSKSSTKRRVRATMESSKVSTRRSMSPEDEESTFGTICAEDASGTTPSLSGSRNSYKTEDSCCSGKMIGNLRGDNNVVAKKTHLHSTVEAGYSHAKGAYGFERCEHTVPEGCDNSPNFLSSKSVRYGPLNAQLFLDHVLYNSNSVQNFRNNASSPTKDKKTSEVHNRTGQSGANTGTPVGMIKSHKPCGFPDGRNVDDSDFLVRYLVKSSVGIQKAVFPHLLTAERASKTTQITPDDLVYAQGHANRGVALAATETAKKAIYPTEKCTELPLHENEIPSTSCRKHKKAIRLKNKLNIFTKTRVPATYKFVKRANRTPGPNTPRSVNKCTQPPPENVDTARRHEAVANRPTRSRLRLKAVKKKAPTHSPRIVSAPKPSTSTSTPQVKPNRAFRPKRMEDNSGSELVSLFRANTGGSSIQSVDMNSSTSVFGIKATSLLKQGKRIKEGDLPSNPRPHSNVHGIVNPSGAHTKPRRENVSPTLTKRSERQSPKARSDSEYKKHRPSSDSGSKKHSSRPPSDSLPKAHSPQTTNDSVLNKHISKVQGNSTPLTRTPSPKALSDRQPQPNSPEAPSDTNTVPKTNSSKPSSDSRPQAQTSKISSGATSKSQSPRLSSDAEPNRHRSKPLTKLGPSTRSPKTSGDSGVSGHAPKPPYESGPQVIIPRGKRSSETDSPKPDQPGRKKRIPSAASTESNRNREKDPAVEIHTEPETKTQLGIGLSNTESSHSSYHISSERKLEYTEAHKNEVNENLKPEYGPNCFGSERGEKEEFSEDVALQIKSASNCSCKIHGGYSLSTTSMIPAVGSYEDRALTPTSCQECCDYNVFFAETLLSSKRKLRSQNIPDTLQNVGLHLDDSRKLPKGADTPLENANDITSLRNTSSSRPYRRSILHQEDRHIDKSNGKAGLKDHEDRNHKSVKEKSRKIWRSAGVLCKSSETESTPSTNPATEPIQSELHTDDNQQQFPVHEALLNKNQETTSLTDIGLILQKAERDQHLAANMAFSVDRLSSQDASQSCCHTSTHSTGSNHKEASHDITSLTDAISCISSIPEDTLPNIASSLPNIVGSNSTHNILVEELCCDYPNAETKEPISCLDAYKCRYYDSSSWPSLSRHKSPNEEPPSFYASEPTEVVNAREKLREIELVQLNAPNSNESDKRCHRSSAGMHVSWDTSMLTTFCVHSKCSRCGAHRKEGTDRCQSAVTCRHDQHQDDNLNTPRNNVHSRHSRCGRCTSYLRDSCINNDRWSQLSSPNSSPRSHNWYRVAANDNTFENPLINCPSAQKEAQCSDIHPFVTQTTSTHPFSCNNFQAPQHRTLHIPVASQAEVSWDVTPTSPSLVVTPGASSLDTETQEHVNENVCRRDEPSRLAVASFWPTMVPTPNTRSSDNLPVHTTEQRIKPNNPRLTLSPVYTTSLPEDVTAKTSRSFNKDIVLQRIADLLENHSSILSIDSYKTMPKEVDKCTAAEPKYYQKNNFGKRPVLAASCHEPRDSDLDRIVVAIADRVNEFLRDMAAAVGELHRK